ncbi:MAG: hypothetical protein UX28_C0001G0139 [Candidatus Pacebacteria bacterium GW2011_GWA1_46_10]|nr:MAG: hypothetical protein UX28_C0001G0139 [Candidatus Pacebacteria bacterium GW2011_GWA1_46_10]
MFPDGAKSSAKSPQLGFPCYTHCLNWLLDLLHAVEEETFGNVPTISLKNLAKVLSTLATKTDLLSRAQSKGLLH